MNLIWHFYVQNLDIVVIEMICAFLIWTVLMILLKGKARRIVSLTAAIISVVMIVSMTVLKRGSAETAQISLIPFISFVRAQEEVEVYRSMLMNICLFMPIGLSIPFVLFERYKHNVLITIAFAFFLSAGIETAQFLFRLGMCETDDVIMNVIGALIGTLSFLIYSRITKFRKKHIHKHIAR